MDREALQRLAQALGPEAELHAVGGWVRDRCLQESGQAPGKGDLDLATALLPGDVIGRARAAGFKAIPTGLPHGTVTVILAGQPVEITTFRGEGAYLDGRRPSSVTLGVGLEQDLARRDFTINALALPIEWMTAADWRKRIVDPFGGVHDLERHLLRAVGDPLERFAEDGLRPLRACRLASQLGFELEDATRKAICQRLDVCAKVAVERVYTELTKLLCGQQPALGLGLLEATGLLDLWLGDLRAMVGCPQNRHHRFNVWEHTLACFEFESTGQPEVRWGLLLHDAGKPGSRTLGEDGAAHFYGHEVVSVEFADRILRRLKSPKRLREKVVALISLHGEHPEPDWSDAAFRRLLKRFDAAGLDPQEWERFCLADRWGKGWQAVGHPDGRSGAEWWRSTQDYWAWARQRLDAVRFPGMTAKELALDGTALMALAGRPAGPWLGKLQKHLLEQVLEEPSRNTAEALAALVRTWLAGQP